MKQKHRRLRQATRVNFLQVATAKPIDRVAYKLRNRGIAPLPTDIRQVIEKYGAARIRGEELVKRVNNCLNDGEAFINIDYIRREYPQYLRRK